MGETPASIQEKQLEELKKRVIEQQQAEEENAKAEQQVEGAMRFLLESEAKQRLGNLRIGNKQLYLRTVQTILMLYKSQRITEKISDDELKKILVKLSEKRETKIKRK